MIYILYGPPGSGKTTIARGSELDEMISHTTRSKRTGEKEGEDYYFLTEEEWQEKYDKGEFIEHTKYHGNYYSLSEKEIKKHINTDNDVVCVLDDVGVKILKDMYGEDNIRTIYMHVPFYISFMRVLERDNLITAIKRTVKALFKGEFNNFYLADFVLNGMDDTYNNLFKFKRIHLGLED